MTGWAWQIASITIGIDPTAFDLGPISIRWYGIMYAVAIFVGARVARRYVDAFGADEQQLWDLFPWAIAAGLLGGRLYYVVQNRQSYYLHNPQHILAFWEGGMAFFGAIGAVAIALLVYAYIHKLSILPILDVAAVFAAVGQPIGRIGNIVNGDIVGRATDLPWGTIYTSRHTFAPETGVAYHPAAAYEIIANLLLLGVMWWVLRRWRPPGLAAALYLVGYATTQFVVFFIRSESITAFGLRQAQLTAIVVFFIGLAFTAYVVRRQQHARVEATPTPA
jgi:phosphatidylglycerol:prolipoprotein diacylglycerol transferase